MAEPLVSSVTVETEGAHEGVRVWLRGQFVGALIVGKGDGAPLASLLLAVSRAPAQATEPCPACGPGPCTPSCPERGWRYKQPDPYLAPELWTEEQRATIPRAVPTARCYVGGGEYQDEPDERAARIPLTGPGSHATDLVALRMEQAQNDELLLQVGTLEATLADVAKGSTHELVRWLLEKLMASEKQFETAQAAFAKRCNYLKSQLGLRHRAMLRAVDQANAASANLAEVIAGVRVRPATDAEQREALDQAAAAHFRADQIGQDIIRERFDADDPRRRALEKVLGGVERKGE